VVGAWYCPPYSRRASRTHPTHITMAQTAVALTLLALLHLGQALHAPDEYFTKNGLTRATWTYDDQNAWPDPYCKGKSQSPINLDRFLAPYALFWPFTFTNYDVVPTSADLKNNGHTIGVEYTMTDTPMISDGKLPGGGPYNFASFHFHWGSSSEKGSEHTINSVRYPAELHLVHYKRTYETLANAISFPDGLAVLGIMLQKGERDNPALAPLIAKIPEVVANNAATTADTLYALSSLLPRDTKSFFRYQGSLTTPTCNEVVTWTVFKEPIQVSEAQLAVLRTMQGATGAIQDNYRAVQPKNMRMVLRSFA